MNCEVLIVAKTRQGAGACIGAIRLDDGQSVRLIAHDVEFDPQHGLEYEVGDVWEVEWRPPEEVLPPHVENIVVRRHRRLRRHQEPLAAIAQHMPIYTGGFAGLYEGHVQRRVGGPLYIAQPHVPAFSTCFWRPDQPLRRDVEGKRVRYRYPSSDGGCTLAFVGFQEPLAELPAGALLRVSLAHWWRPPEHPQEEPRCFVQLSGWFLDEDPAPGPRVSTAFTQPAPTLAQAEEALHQVFGYDSFRPLQAEIVETVLRGQDTLVVMPTGGGKSLCYQLPALVLDGLTVVVSPLIALMQDQVDALRELGVAATFLNSTLEYRRYLEIAQALRRGGYKLLYVAPETLLRPETLLLLEECRVRCLAIDEAHCISQWGHDFRPEYRQLAEARRRFPAAVCIALTATASPRVQEDIRDQLHLATDATFVASFDRPNLRLAVELRLDGQAQVLEFIAAHPDQAGIVYCATRRQVEDLAEYLVKHGVAALPYHAGMDKAAREQNQRRFLRDESTIMVATIAFGMGIDKPDVRFVLHYNLPQDLESYYQQIGRAGRDGLPAECVLFFHYADIFTIQRFIEGGEPEQARPRNLRLQALVTWAESEVCRRAQILTHFGETPLAERCGNCDNCTTPLPERAPVDLTIHAQKFLSCVLRTHEGFGVNHVIGVLRGSQAQSVLRYRHNHLSTYGIGGDLSTATWRHLAHQFLAQGLARQDVEKGFLTVTERGRAVLKGAPVRGTLIQRSVWSNAAPVGVQSGYALEEDLLRELRRLRWEIADAAGVPAYIIFYDRTLLDLATYLPQSLAALAEVHGMGQRKLERYGDQLLEVVGGYCAARGLAERPRLRQAPVAALSAESALTRRTRQIVETFLELKDVAETAAAHNIMPASVLTHLTKAILAGERLPVEPLYARVSLPPAQQAEVMAAFHELGDLRLSPVFDRFEGAILYEQLHWLRLIFRIGRADPAL